MTDQEINVAIAVASGWKNVREEDGWWNVRPDGKRFPSFQNSDHGMPDCCNDLNAMHEAEKTLLKDDNHAHGCYCSYLFERVDNCMCATARQRAEAFLKTIGGWKE